MPGKWAGHVPCLTSALGGLQKPSHVRAGGGSRIALPWASSEPQQAGSSGIICLAGAQVEILGDKGPVVFAQGWANDGAAGQVLR